MAFSTWKNTGRAKPSGHRWARRALPILQLALRYLRNKQAENERLHAEIEALKAEVARGGNSEAFGVGLPITVLLNQKRIRFMSEPVHEVKI